MKIGLGVALVVISACLETPTVFTANVSASATQSGVVVNAHPNGADIQTWDETVAPSSP